jgi:4,4'-diaponeurosporenoate glycosyltransferase
MALGKAKMELIEVSIYFLFWLLGFLFLFRIPSCKDAPDAQGKFPPVSVIIPARNEEHSLPFLLSSLQSQTLKPSEIIVVDDNSEDATAEVAAKGGAKVIHAKKLPEGWHGKPWACWTGAQEAQGEILVFLDADTSVLPDGLLKIVGAYAEKKGLVSVQPYHTMEKLYEELSAIFNIIVMAGLNAFTILGEKVKPSGVFGPCLVIGKDDYFTVGGHKKVKDTVLEDIAIGQLYKKEDFVIRCYGGKGTISFRMYPHGIMQLMEGWSKGFAEGAEGISLGMLLMIILWVAGGAGDIRILLKALLTGDNVVLLLAGLLYIFYAVQIYWMLFRVGNFKFFTALLFPVPLLFFIMLFCYSLVLKIFKKRVTWKGRTLRTDKS